MKKKTTNFKVAILGCGRVALHYHKIFKLNKIKNIDIVGVCDLNINKAKVFANKFNSRYFTDLSNMLNQLKIDLLIICTPSGSHYRNAKTTLDKNINVLVEKPITMKPDQGKKLINIAKKKNLYLGVAFQNRFNSAIKCLKNAVVKKRFGKIITIAVVLRWCRYQDYYNDEWHGSWKHDGGVINQQAIHHIDSLNWIFGPIKSVNSIIGNRLNKLQAEDTFVSSLELKNGALCTVEATTAARPKDYEASISVLGEKGYAKIGGIALNEITDWNFLNKKKEDKTVKKLYSQKFDNGYGLSHLPLIIDSLSQISLKKKDYSSTYSALTTTKIIHAFYLSAERKKMVLLSDNPKSRKLGK
jgi:UDP-N-acetyl-2-amino-2-deoxyglucuronate dehydrogenase